MYFAHVLLKGEPKDFSVHNFLFYYQHHSFNVDFFFLFLKYSTWKGYNELSCLKHTLGFCRGTFPLRPALRSPVRWNVTSHEGDNSQWQLYVNFAFRY